MTLNKPLVSLLAAALAATFGYAVAQDNSSTMSTDPQAGATAPASPSAMPDASTTPAPVQTTTTETQTVIIPGQNNGVVPSKPAGTYKAAPGSVEPQNVMGSGVNFGSTRINVGDHASPRLPAPPEVLSVKSETTTTTTPVAQQPAPPAQAAPVETVVTPAPVAAPAPEPEAAPAPAPRADRN